MPIKKAAKKALRQSKKRRSRNLQIKQGLKETIKRFRALVEKKKTKEAQDLLKKCYRLLDLAAKKKVIKKNTASRKKSRLTSALNKINQSKSVK